MGFLIPFFLKNPSILEHKKKAMTNGSKRFNCGLIFLLFFFASPKKNQKKSPTKDYIAFVG